MHGTEPSATETFLAQRSRLIGIAHGIVGDLGEAEDIVQDTWLRLRRADDEDIDDLIGWLVVVTSRLALDVVRSARHAREHYVGPWLPEPIVTGLGDEVDPADRVTLAESVSTAVLVVLQTLSPAERTAFLLHDMFGHPFDEIAAIVGRSPTAVRQLASRARRHVTGRASRFNPAPAEQHESPRAFIAACESGRIDRLLPLLDENVVLRSDGSGVVRAARHPILGADKVARFVLGVRARTSWRDYPVEVNGSAGFLSFREDRLSSVNALTWSGNRLVAIDSVLHPDKLARTRAWWKERTIS